MEYVGNQCSQNGEFIIIGRARLLLLLYAGVPYGFIMRRKYFAGNFSPRIIINNEYANNMPDIILDIKLCYTIKPS